MIPQIGLAGEYKVKAPFTLEPDSSYICRGISSIQSLIDKGVDVYKEYYEVNGVSEDDFQSDLAKDAVIVTLKDNEGIAYNIPSTYIEDIPTDVEVPYIRFGLMAELGLLPSNEDLTYLMDTIKEQIRTTVGLETSVVLAKLPFDGFVTKEEHKYFLLERETNISYDKSPLLALKDAQVTIQSQKQRIEALEQIIIDMQTTP